MSRAKWFLPVPVSPVINKGTSYEAASVTESTRPSSDGVCDVSRRPMRQPGRFFFDAAEAAAPPEVVSHELL